MREQGHRMVRYADDFVVLCRSAVEAEQALETIQAWVRTAGLSLHPTKSRLTDLGQPGGYFDFLGYRFYGKPEGGIGRTIKPKKRQSLYRRLATLTPRCNGKSTEELVDTVNVWLRGVFVYFQHADRLALANLDAHVRYRLRRIFAKRIGLAGCAKRKRAHQLWRNSHFVALGLFSLSATRDGILHSHSGPA